MIKQFVSLTAVFLFFSSCVVYGFEMNEFNKNYSFVVGQKNLDSDDWNTLDKQPEIGLEFDAAKNHWPVNAVLGIIYSKKNNTAFSTYFSGSKLEFIKYDLEASTIEIYGGIKKIFRSYEEKTYHPFVAGGITSIYGKLKNELERTISDSTIGVWMSAGINFMLGEKYFLGGLLRYSSGKLSFQGRDVHGGGSHYMFSVGMHF
ncbi:MAG: hypothetical protein ABII27_04190 [bacterium]